MIIKNADVFCEDGVFRTKDICTDGERISSFSDSDEILDAQDCYAVPGLIDIHFHGCVGYDFCDGTEKAIREIASYEAENGVLAICPATMTLPEETLMTIAEAAAAYQGDSGADPVGIHMEGPFINEAKKGAQNPAYIHKPDVEMYERLQKASNGLFKLVDIAPETEGAMEFIRQVKDEAVISIAHTAADYDTAVKAIENGVSHVTHLYNAMPGYSHRAPGVIGAACDHGLDVELICDGIHIHPSAVRTTFKMFGDNKIILISDSMMATGMEDGTYQLGGQDVKVVGNLATLAEGGAIAGSATNLMDCLRTAVKAMGIPLNSAVKCATENPAKSIGIYDSYGSISEGKYANVVLLDKDLDIKAIIKKGKILKQN